MSQEDGAAGIFLLTGVGMDAALFMVTSTQVGWLVCEGDCVADVCSSRFWALKAADALAYRRYADTGQPCAVVLKYADGNAVVAGRYD